MAKLFISYARSTAARARLIAETLEAEGHEVWIDDQLLSHRSFTDSIEEKLNSADAVVVAWSNDATRSEWVRAEANRARLAGKLVQVRLDSCALPLPYDEIHCIDISSWSGDFQLPQWRAVQASIAAVTGNPTQSTLIAPGRPSTGRRAGAPAEQRRGERRQVTALYCDLMDTGSLASLDPEDMMQVLDVYQAACDDIIAQHGGSIAKYMGHGLLAYFGYPRGDEEDAANAVRAGLALCEHIGGLDLPEKVALRIRVGVATGLVVISELIGRNAVRETGVVGETPNLATQLETAAPPNAVVVSAATRRITSGLFTYRDLGSVSLPGYENGVRAFEAAESTQIASRSQARTHNPATPLFGRESDLSQMLESWSLACQGDGQIVLLQGEAGIGKSSLVDAFRARASETPSVQTTFYCGPNHSQTSLHPISEQLARAAGFERGDSPDLRRDKLFGFLRRYDVSGPLGHAALADLLAIPPENPDPTEGLTTERRKAVTLDTMLSFVERWAVDQPALLIFEDLHWADPTTLELLDLAIRRAVDRPWLILATARPEFEARWSDHADVRNIQLGRLGHDDSERLCESLGAKALLPADVVRQIIERADGIPLFVEEITKSVLEATAAAGERDSAARISIPNTLQDSLAARLDRLGQAKHVACLAAAIGRRFGYELLAAIAPSPAAELRQSLRELTKSGLVERSGVPPNSQYLFKHALIRDAAYEALLKKEREALHGKIAVALTTLFPETPQADPALLAYHLTESGAFAEAIPLWAEAGRQAASRAAHAEAVSRLQTALDLIRRLPPDAGRTGLELQLLLGLAVSLGASRGYSVPEVRTVLSEARTICDRLGNVADLYWVLRNLCNFSITVSDLVAAEESAWLCSAIADQTGASEHRIEADAALGYIFTMKGAFPTARLHIERVISLYKKVNGAGLTFPTPQDPMVVALGVYPLVLYALGDTAAANAAVDDALAHARALGRSFDLAFALSWAATHDNIVGNYVRSLALSKEALAICESNRSDTYANVAKNQISYCVGRTSHAPEMTKALTEGTASLRKLGVLSMRCYYLCLLSEMELSYGDATAALSTIDTAIDHALQFGDRYMLSRLYYRRAEALTILPNAGSVAVTDSLQLAVSTAEEQGAREFASQARARLAGIGGVEI